MLVNHIYCGNCLDVMKTMDDDSIDAIVTDPPYGISFMGKKWDYDVPSIEIWQEVYRILKPGAHMLVACGTRTFHKMVARIEDAGFYPKDIIVWAYGSGFPKSLNISKAIDKELGCERGIGKPILRPDGTFRINTIKHSGDIFQCGSNDKMESLPSSDLAKQYDGYGTQLKPAMEMFSLLQKPISEKTIAKNVMKWGTGGINIDACRVKTNDKLNGGGTSGSVCWKDGWSRPWMENQDMVNDMADRKKQAVAKAESLGRFPANLIHDGSQQVLDLFPDVKISWAKLSNRETKTIQTVFGDRKVTAENDIRKLDTEQTQSASRFFYCAKASSSEKNRGLPTDMKNIHPTVKPIKLMEYLVRLITPSEGTVLDPFCGSGSTLVAAINEGFNYIGIELSQEYCDIAQQRINIEIK